MKRESLSNQLVKEILARIARGVWAEGHRLPAERELARQFGVSRVTVRQAMAALRGLGVLRCRHGSGSYVSSAEIPAGADEFVSDTVGFDPAALEEIITARKAIERVTAPLAAERRSTADVRALRQCLDEMKACVDDVHGYIAADMRFHRIMAVASGNTVLVRLMDAIEDQQRYSQVFTGHFRNEERRTIRAHERILQAIVDRDPAAARREIGRHLREMEAYLADATPPRKAKRKGAARC